MNKITFLLTLYVFCLTSVFAQKYGHVNSEEIMQNMPGIGTVQIKMAEFQKNLETMYENTVNEFQTKKEKFDRESGSWSASVRKMREDELIALQNRIQEIQYNAQEDIEQEQERLITPFKEKVQNAIHEVANEYLFNYILDTQILLYYKSANDITPLVKKKLGIK